jgi:hypothetical protein
VPNYFVLHLEDYFKKNPLDHYNIVSPVKKLFDKTFWKTLDKNDRKVVGLCVLFLLEQGRIWVPCPDQFEEIV